MAIFVTKADGTRQRLDKGKIVKTCIRMGVSKEAAEEIAQRIEMQVYDGIKTKQILNKIFREIRKYKPEAKHVICLRESLSFLRPRPDFERFIQLLLKEHGYAVTSNRFLKGRCVEHEMDAVIQKNGNTIIVEVKHHTNFHARTGLDESRIARAILEDVNEGFQLGLNDFKADWAMIVTNTKFSNHAKIYAKCRNIHLIGWSYPNERSLQTLIESKKLMPITYLRNLRVSDRKKLLSAGILLLRQLLIENPQTLSTKTKLSRETSKSIIDKAAIILRSTPTVQSTK
jgi:HJR/Mrr/RecB family endonuclease